jgi:hypothetical protein
VTRNKENLNKNRNCQKNYFEKTIKRNQKMFGMQLVSAIEIA